MPLYFDLIGNKIFKTIVVTSDDKMLDLCQISIVLSPRIGPLSEDKVVVTVNYHGW